MQTLYASRDQFEQVVHLWWSRLHTETKLDGDESNIVRRQDAAELKRAQSIGDVLQMPAYYHLYTLLLEAALPENVQGEQTTTFRLAESQLELLAALAMICPLVREDMPATNLGVALASTSESKKTLLSEHRFMKLIRAKTLEELTQHLRRTIPVIKKKLPIKALIRELYGWQKDAPRHRQRWAEDYFTSSHIFKLTAN